MSKKKSPKNNKADGKPAVSKRRILFPLGHREIVATGERIVNIPRFLVTSGFDVDVMTYREDIFEIAEKKLGQIEGINIQLTIQEERFWTMVERDSFTKTFIKLNHDLEIPDFALKYWKLVGFDDFLWNFAPMVFPKLQQKYDVILFPIPSFNEPPALRCDVFFTNIIYHANEFKIPIVGLQVYPVFDIPPIYPYILDDVVVKTENEKEFYLDAGLDESHVNMIDELRETYSLSTIEDSYQQLALSDDIAIDSDELSIVIINHARNRQQLHEMINTISDLQIPMTVFFCLLDYTVKELHELDIYNDITKPLLQKAFGNFYTVEPGGIISALMISDVIISTIYMIPLAFANKHNKLGLVYNPLLDEIPQVDDIAVIADPQGLKDRLLQCLEDKKQQRTIAKVITDVLS